MKRTRTFIAVTPPQSVKDHIARLMSQIAEKSAYRQYIRFINPGNAHITITFLGGLTGERVQEVIDTTHVVAERYPKFTLRLTGLNYFYEQTGPEGSTIYLDIQDKDKNLNIIHKQFYKNLSGLGFSPALRFQPHLTLGRVTRHRLAHLNKEILQQIVEVEIPHSDEFQISTLNVYQNYTSHKFGEPRYKIIKKLNLQ